MAIDFKVPWERYGIISYLSKAMENFSVQFGKTSLQKMVYILQEIYDVKIGYPYTLHNYGPYSVDLANDLDYIAALKGVEISWVNTGGYSIKSNIASDAFISKSSNFIESNKDEMGKALSIFGGFSAKELELRATIIYFIKEYDGKDEYDLVEQVHQLKPYFSREKIRATIAELKDCKVIK